MNSIHKFSHPTPPEEGYIHGIPYGDSEESIRLESQLFREFLKHTKDYVYFKDLESRFLRVSQSMVPEVDPETWTAEDYRIERKEEIESAQIRSIEDMIGLSDREYFPSDAERTISEEHAAMEANKPILNASEEDGGSYLDTNKIPIEDNQGEVMGLYGITRDVTARVTAEMAIKRYSARLQSIVSTQRELVEAEPYRDLVLHLVCQRVQELTDADGAAIILAGEEGLEYSMVTGIAKPFSNRLITDKPQSILDRIEATTHIIAELADETFILPEIPELGAHSLLAVPLFGSENVMIGFLLTLAEKPDAFDHEEANAIGICAVILSASLGNVSEWESKRAEVAALARYQTIFETSPIAIMKGDIDGRVVDANPAAERLLGYTIAELTKMKFSDLLFSVTEIRADKALFSELVAGKREFYQLESRFRRKDGETVWGQVTTALERDASGRAVSPIAMFEDVTERRLTAEHALQTQKTEAIGQLTAGIAHDFNNLLMGLLGFVELARLESPDGGEQAEYLDEALTTGRRAAELVKHLLSFGGGQTLQSRRIDLNELINETILMLGHLIDAPVEMEFVPTDNLPTIMADPTLIQQVLINLSINARDAMPGGGLIKTTTEVATVDDDARWRNLNLPPGEYVVLSVQDTGYGMSEETISHIFEPFFSTKPTYEGSGLGLSSVYGIVKQTQGAIGVESEVGVGTTFHIYLPVAPADNESAPG